MLVIAIIIKFVLLVAGELDLGENVTTVCEGYVIWNRNSKLN